MGVAGGSTGLTYTPPSYARFAIISVFSGSWVYMGIMGTLVSLWGITRINNDALTVSSYDNEIMRKQTFDELHKMVDNLPTEQREMVYLRYFEELSFKEIAEITGVSINTALGRMRYAIINLRKMANMAYL